MRQEADAGALLRQRFVLLFCRAPFTHAAIVVTPCRLSAYDALHMSDLMLLLMILRYALLLRYARY